MQILICDDEIQAADELYCMLQNIFKEKSIDAVIIKETDAKRIMDVKECYDMAFLDIELGEIRGIELAEAILRQNSGCFVFFVTNYSTYLDEAFDVKAFRYITKPVDKKRVESSVNKALEKIEERNKRIVLSIKNKRKMEISVNSIIYIENSNRHTYVVAKDGDFVADEPFGVVKALLEDMSEDFILAHQSFLVNIKYVSYYDSTTVRLKHKEQEYSVHMSRRKYDAFDDKMFMEANKQRW